MTIRLPKGDSLAKVYYASQKRHAWVSKLYNNVRAKLERLGSIVVLGPSSLREQNALVLYWSGSAEHLKRIEKVLGVTFDKNHEAEGVKFSRIALKVKLLERNRLAA